MVTPDGGFEFQAKCMALIHAGMIWGLCRGLKTCVYGVAGCKGCKKGLCTKILGGRIIRCLHCDAGFFLKRLDDLISRVCLRGMKSQRKEGATDVVALIISGTPSNPLCSLLELFLVDFVFVHSH